MPLLKVFTPANVLAPVVTIPLALPVALGTATASLAPPSVVTFNVGPAEVPPVQATTGFVNDAHVGALVAPTALRY